MLEPHCLTHHFLPDETDTIDNVASATFASELLCQVFGAGVVLEDERGFLLRVAQLAQQASHPDGLFDGLGQSTADLKLKLKLGGKDKKIKLFGYADVSFIAGVQLGCCFKDKTVSLSSTESELKALWYAAASMAASW